MLAQFQTLSWELVLARISVYQIFFCLTHRPFPRSWIKGEVRSYALLPLGWLTVKPFFPIYCHCRVSLGAVDSRCALFSKKIAESWNVSVPFERDFLERFQSRWSFLCVQLVKCMSALIASSPCQQFPLSNWISFNIISLNISSFSIDMWQITSNSVPSNNSKDLYLP